MYKLNQKGASSWDLVLKILSITLVSLFAFSSGVWFGKKLSDSDYQRLALEGEFDREVHKGDRETASTNGDDVDETAEAAGHDSEALTEEEVASAADKAIRGEKTEPAEDHSGHDKDQKKASAAVVGQAKEHGDSHAAHGSRVVASASTAAATPLMKPDLSAAHQAANRVANNTAPVGKEIPKPESRVPSSLPKTVGTTNDVEFTVQVASYPTSEAAKEHVDSLVKKGFPAFPVEAKIGGKVWFRVSVGSFKSFVDASKYRAQLVKQTELPSAIVTKISRQ